MSILLQALHDITNEESAGTALKVYGGFTSFFLVRLLIDVLAAFILIRFVHYPNYRRREVFFSLFMFNLVTFTLTYMLKRVELSMGAAFGLFAVFSMLNYRTQNITTKEMTYFFVLIALGLINAIAMRSWIVLASLNGAFIVVTYLLDSGLLWRKETSRTLTYERIELVNPRRRKELIADLEDRLAIRINSVNVDKIDYLKETAQIDVHYYVGNTLDSDFTDANSNGNSKNDHRVSSNGRDKDDKDDKDNKSKKEKKEEKKERKEEKKEEKKREQIQEDIRDAREQERQDNVFMPIVLALCFASFMYGTVTAQTYDAGLWTSVAIEKKLSKQFTIGIAEEVRLNENITQVGTIQTDLGFDFKPVKNLSFGFYYRFSQKRQEDGFYTPRHRGYVNAAFKHSANKFTLGLRERFQRQYTGINRSETGNVPDDYLRNKLTLQYEAAEKIAPYVSGETFHPLNTDKPFLDNVRVAAGVEYAFDKRSALDVYYMVNRELNAKDPVTDYVVGVGYKLSI